MGGTLQVVSTQPLPQLTVTKSAALPGEFGEGTNVTNTAERLGAKALQGAGLPTSLANIPEWLSGLKNFNIQHLFIEPIKKAIDNPTMENIVDTIPLLGPLANSLSKDVESGDIVGGALRLAGSLAMTKGMGQVAPGAAAIKAQVADARDIISRVAKVTQGHSLTATALDQILPENASVDFKGGAYSDYFGESGKAVPITKSPNFDPAAYRAGAALRTTQPVEPPTPKAPPSAFEGATSTAGGAPPTGDLPKGTATPFTAPSNVQLVSKFTPQQASEPSVIQSPLSPPPAVNRTLVSYDRNILVHMARSGDLNALRELIRNPGSINLDEALPNWGHLIERNAPTRIYGGPGSEK